MLRIEQIIAADNETHLIRPAQLAPKMVCLQVADHRGVEVIHRRDPRCQRRVAQIIDECLCGDAYLAGQSTAFDIAVWANEWPHYLPLFFRMYDEGRILDTMTRQKLIDIAKGEYSLWRHPPRGYSLAVLAKRHGFPRDLEKDDWRLRYAELDNVPVDQWPEKARTYAEDDALSTLHVCASQEDDAEYLEDQHRQARGAFALHLISAWGIRTDRVMVERHKRNTIIELDSYRDTLLAADLIYKDKKGVWHKRSKKAAELCVSAWRAKGFEEVPEDYRTEGGAPSISEDAANALGDPLITAFQRFSSASTIMNRVEELEQGVDMPIHTRFDELMDSGRTSSSKPNIQNRAVEPGDRECFVPRKGNVYLDADFDGLELRTISQSLIYAGLKPRLAVALNKGDDPHAMVAASLLGVPYEEVLRRKDDPTDEAVYLARQSGKIANFGLNAGLGKHGLIIQARSKYNVNLTLDEAAKLIDTWHQTWPEFREFFAWVRSITASGRGWIKHFVSNRHRGNIPYTVVCNTFSQGLGADAMKEAMYALVKECYIGTGILRGSRVVNFVHDQFITEVPDCDQLDDFAKAKQAILTEAANKWLPDVPTRAKPMAARRWSKLAKRRTDTSGRLIAWEWDEAIKAGSKGYAE